MMKRMLLLWVAVVCCSVAVAQSKTDQAQARAVAQEFLDYVNANENKAASLGQKRADMETWLVEFYEPIKTLQKRWDPIVAKRGKYLPCAMMLDAFRVYGGDVFLARGRPPAANERQYAMNKENYTLAKAGCVDALR